ncbi:MAG: hypothetical protein LBL96_01265, partial [Clostridiales bacterium]|jgi:hypothetical protein|nr:hypothetical protein [Clostridiales bacterium]
LQSYESLGNVAFPTQHAVMKHYPKTQYFKDLRTYGSSIACGGVPPQAAGWCGVVLVNLSVR